MSDSKQKVIGRNRAPRVQIEYDVEHYGSQSTIELPFVMGVMGDFVGDSESNEAQKPIGKREFSEINSGTFDTEMNKLAPRVKTRVANKLSSDDEGQAEDELMVDLTFRSMSDFSPDKIAEQVPALAELLKMRRQLSELLSYMDGKVDAEKRIAELLTNEPLLREIADKAISKDKTDGDSQ